MSIQWKRRQRPESAGSARGRMKDRGSRAPGSTSRRRSEEARTAARPGTVLHVHAEPKRTAPVLTDRPRVERFRRSIRAVQGQVAGHQEPRRRSGYDDQAANTAGIVGMTKAIAQASSEPCWGVPDGSPRPAVPRRTRRREPPATSYTPSVPRSYRRLAKSLCREQALSAVASKGARRTRRAGGARCAWSRIPIGPRGCPCAAGDGGGSALDAAHREAGGHAPAERVVDRDRRQRVD
jgi:hypothetical protein